MGDMAAVKVLKNVVCFIIKWDISLSWKHMLRYLYWCIFLQCTFKCPINVCTNFESNRYNIDEFRRMFHFAINQKSLRLPVQTLWPNVCFCLCFWWHWPWHLTYILLLSHNVRMTYWSLIEKFHKKPSSINGWYSRRHTHTYTHKHTPKVKTIVSQIPIMITYYGAI